MTFDDFIEWEQAQEGKHDLMDGVPVRVPLKNEGHVTIQVNLCVAAHKQLKGNISYRVFGSDIVVRTGEDAARYMDCIIDGGRRHPKNRYLSDPAVVFEIVGEQELRLAEYGAVPSVRQYVAVSQGEPLLHIHNKSEGGGFSAPPTTVRGIDGAVDLTAVGIVLTMGEIYEGVGL